MVSRPWLLYAYPWMPYPRRIIIYLRERGIPSSLVTVIRVSDPGQGNQVINTGINTSVPPRPSGSLPILAVPRGDITGPITINTNTNSDNQGDSLTTKASDGTASINAVKEDKEREDRDSFIYIRQSLAIMNFLEDVCERRLYGFHLSNFMGGSSKENEDLLDRARVQELLAVADELTGLWNPVRSFGTGAGPVRIPAAAKEMLRWVRRSLLTAEGLVAEKYLADNRSYQSIDSRAVSIADIVLYQYFEFMEDCYGVDMTDLPSSPLLAKELMSKKGKREERKNESTTDVYGRSVTYQFPSLKRFYREFRQRPSARRDADAGEVPDPATYARMTDWSDGVLDE